MILKGLPTLFYKSQYQIIKDDLLQLNNSIFFLNKNFSLNDSSNYYLTFKKTRNELLKNWRPISLLCVDYKILTKIISNRLKLKLPQAISKEQTCGISNRSISKIKNINFYIVSADQEKAFDKVDQEFVYKIMKKLG